MAPFLCQDRRSPSVPSLDSILSSLQNRTLTAAERVMTSEFQTRGVSCDALSMMVSSVARMVQAGKSSDSRWKSS